MSTTALVLATSPSISVLTFHGHLALIYLALLLQIQLADSESLLQMLVGVCFRFVFGQVWVVSPELLLQNGGRHKIQKSGGTKWWEAQNSE